MRSKLAKDDGQYRYDHKSDDNTTRNHYYSDPARMLACENAHFDRFGPAAVLPSPPPSLSLSLSPSSMSSHLHTYTHFADTSHNFNNINNSINNINNINSNINIHQPLKEDDVPDYMLEIRQQPRHARVALGKDKADRKPIDPPPILQLKVSTKKDPNQHFLQSPYYFMSCSLIKSDDSSTKDPLPSHLIGTAVSSLHRLKDTDNQDGGFFVFGDLSCKAEGKFRLLFTLYQMQRMECLHITSIVSQVFQVYPTKSFPGLAESTFLTRSFSDQGVRLRLRKDSRSMTSRKRNATAADFTRKPTGPGPRDQGPAVAPVSRRSLGGRTGSADDTPYASVGLTGSGFDPSNSYGSYDTDSSNYSKRRRMLGGGGSDLGAGTSVTAVITTNPYGVPSAYGTTASHMQMPVSTVGTGSYGLSTMQPAGLSNMGYGGHPHAHVHSHHQLSRIDTQQSPSTRQSSHAFQYAATLQTSPSSINDYRPLYASTVSTADASPRTHATPNTHSTTTPSGTSTSPSDATANYTAQPGVGVSGIPGAGSIAPFSQNMAPYTYTGALGDPSQHQHQHQHPHQHQYQHHHQNHHQHHPQQHQAHHMQHQQQPPLQHVSSTGLDLDLNYTEVDRHNSN
ncbi:developmental regulator [Ophiostoma piceae UAMH 11346]|uniref:Developmental regulator n=1 Tax=Ophiostoma piceae (strain UAMH 11346) TaxID=1262450 RepID=S3CC50_OPHP1|nr:developmental regulator [Ophiostoma piceae UAMH 11346]